MVSPPQLFVGSAGSTARFGKHTYLNYSRSVNENIHDEGMFKVKGDRWHNAVVIVHPLPFCHTGREMQMPENDDVQSKNMSTVLFAQMISESVVCH